MSFEIFHNAFADRKTDPRSGIGAVAVQALKGVEDDVEIGRFDADSVIGK